MIEKKRRFVAYLGHTEAASLLLLLLVGLPLKYLAGMPLFTRFVGAAHGGLFLAYVATLIVVGPAIGLRGKQILLGIVLSCVPLGPLYFDSRLKETSR